jgi:hypothetical protein
MVQVTVDAYILDGLLRDIVGHDRRPASFIVYLHLYRHACQKVNWSIQLSHQSIADATGLSRSTVQGSLSHLQRRQLVATSRANPTAVPLHRVLRPWQRPARGRN